MLELGLALCGAGIGLGMTLIAAGWVGHADPQVFGPSSGLRTWWSQRIRRPRWSWFAAAATGAAVWLLTGWPVAGIAVAVLVGFGPWLFSAGKVAARQIDRLEALEDWLRRLADTMGTGNTGMLGAILTSAHDAPAGIAEEVTALAQRLRSWDLQDALLAFADEIDDQIGDAAAAGLCVAYQQGAGTAELLRTLAQQVAEDVTARRNAEADRAKRRYSARILLAIWGLMFLSFAMLGGSAYTSVYHTVLGQAVLAIVLGVVGTAVVWLRRLGTEPRAPRFLTSPKDAKP